MNNNYIVFSEMWFLLKFTKLLYDTSFCKKLLEKEMMKQSLTTWPSTSTTASLLSF